MDRPSRSTSVESDSVPVAPRDVTFTSRAEVTTVFSPGTRRSMSVITCAGAVPITSSVITVIVAGALTSCSSRLDAVTTTTSSAASPSWLAEWIGDGGGSWASAAGATASSRITIAITPGMSACIWALRIPRTARRRGRYTSAALVDYGGSRHFATTRWSIVLAAGAGPVQADAREALASLCETYWYPLYAYLRGRGHSAEDAEDLTQAFFARVFEKETFRQADPARGKFRSFLLTALKNFAVNEHDRHTAQKRGGGVPVVSLEFEGAEGRYQREPSTAETPERIFDRTWALTLLDRVMSRLADEAG